MGSRPARCGEVFFVCVSLKGFQNGQIMCGRASVEEETTVVFESHKCCWLVFSSP